MKRLFFLSSSSLLFVFAAGARGQNKPDNFLLCWGQLVILGRGPVIGLFVFSSLERWGGGGE